MDDASARLKDVIGGRKGTLGLVPDEVKRSQAYKKAKADFDKANPAVRWYTRIS